jgi:hypothetical protein
VTVELRVCGETLFPEAVQELLRTLHGVGFFEDPVLVGSWGGSPASEHLATIDRIVKLNCKLTDYSLRAVTGGKDAIGEVYVRLKCGKNEVSAKGASTDVIEASVKAYVNAINKLFFLRG